LATIAPSPCPAPQKHKHTQNNTKAAGKGSIKAYVSKKIDLMSE
jgi:hypothetical protein